MSAEKARTWTRQLVTFLIIFLLAGYLMYRNPRCGAAPGQGVRPAQARIVEVGIGDQSIQAEVADTAGLRRKGLQGRTALEPGCGMLFVFDEPDTVRFWMANTTIPLSIAFIKADGTIVQIEKMQPQDLRHVTSNEPVKYALEVRQDYFEDHGFEPGIKARIPAEMPTAAPVVAPEAPVAE